MYFSRQIGMIDYTFQMFLRLVQSQYVKNQFLTGSEIVERSIRGKMIK